MATPFTPPPADETTDDDMSPRQMAGFLIGAVSALMPGFEAAGFSEILGLGFVPALLIAIVGGGIAGVLVTGETVKGSITGIVVCAGITLGILGYVAARMAMAPSSTFLKLELVVGIIIGAIPGMILAGTWFKDELDALGDD